jgi:tetratricopeptide (TPR) repeat protein
MSLPYAAGAMYSTVEDLYLWDQALYTEQVLTAQSKDLMFKPHLDDYAYGWVVNKVSFTEGSEGVQRIKHGGGINGFNTVITRFPAEKHLIILLDNTSQGGNLNRLERELTNILYDKPYSSPKMSIGEKIFKTVQDKGIAAGVSEYRDLKARQANLYDFGEPELNTLGYLLLQSQKVKEAIEIFKLNVEAYPQGFNTYDSLGEAYMVNGEKELAIQNYKKSLELNPQNSNATAMLKKLEEK